MHQSIKVSPTEIHNQHADSMRVQVGLRLVSGAEQGPTAPGQQQEDAVHAIREASPEHHPFL